jgi:hypothetical protein
MDDQETYFDQIPGRLAKKVSQQAKENDIEGCGTTRPWQDIAEEVTKERDPNRLAELVGELNDALDAECHRKAREASSPPGE